MALIGAAKVACTAKVKTTVQMIATWFLLYDGRLFDVTHAPVGYLADLISAVLTVWSMIYYPQNHPEIRFRAK
jgi:phosphatidylglycerophosphate synthase